MLRSEDNTNVKVGMTLIYRLGGGYSRKIKGITAETGQYYRSSEVLTSPCPLNNSQIINFYYRLKIARFGKVKMNECMSVLLTLEIELVNEKKEERVQTFVISSSRLKLNSKTTI